MKRIISGGQLGVMLLAAYVLGIQTVWLAFTVGEPRGLALVYQQGLGTLAFVAVLGDSLLLAVRKLPALPSPAVTGAGEESGLRERSLEDDAEQLRILKPVLRGVLVLIGLVGMGGGSLVRSPAGWHGLPGLFFVALGGYFLALGTAGFTGLWKERHYQASVPAGDDTTPCGRER